MTNSGYCRGNGAAPPCSRFHSLNRGVAGSERTSESLGQRPAPGAGPATATRRLSAGISRYRAEDGDDLRGFVRSHYGDQSYQADDRYFDWRFADHPEIPRESPTIWVCRREGRVVGQQAALPFTVRAGGAVIPAAWAIDLMVDPEWRLRGVAPALTAQLCADRPLVAGLGIAAAARRGFARAGWVDLGRVPRYVRLLRPLRAGEAPTGRRPVRPAAALASRAAVPVLGLLAGTEAAVLGGARLGGLRFQAIERFDDRVEPLWAAVAPTHPLIAHRGLRSLAWRFDAAPQPAVYRKYYLTRGARVLGYAVLRRRQETMMVVDHLCLPGWHWALFAHCLAEARRAGAAALRCLATGRKARRSLLALGFLPRPGPHFMAFAHPLSGLAASLVGEPGNWYLTEADSDLDHPPLP